MASIPPHHSGRQTQSGEGHIADACHQSFSQPTTECISCILRLNQLQVSQCINVLLPGYTSGSEDGFLLGRQTHNNTEACSKCEAFTCANCSGSNLVEACAAGCAVVTGSCNNMFIQAADVNQAAARSSLAEASSGGQSFLQGQEVGQLEGPRCQNPTPRHAAG